MSLFGDIGNFMLGGALTGWNIYQQEHSWNREDNSVQRRAEDLRKAGMNPQLAAGSAASSGPVVSTSVPRSPDPIDRERDAVNFALAASKQQADISRTYAEQSMIEHQFGKIDADIAASKANAYNAYQSGLTTQYNREYAKAAGLPTNPGSTGSTIRDLSGVIKNIGDSVNSSPSAQAMRDIQSKTVDNLPKAQQRNPYAK